MKWLKAWRIRRLECYLAAHKAERLESDRLERITGNAYAARTLRLARETGRLEKQIEQLKEHP